MVGKATTRLGWVVEFSDVVRRRRMVRAYDPTRQVSREIRDQLLDAAVRAPSAGFTQGWSFLVLEEEADRGLFWRVTSETDTPADRWLRGVRTAPLLIVCFSNREAYVERYAQDDKKESDLVSRWPVPYWHIDTGFAALLILLCAVDLGLGACFFGVPPGRVGALLEAFEIPDGFVPVGVTSVGYPAADYRSTSLSRGRKFMDDVVHLGRWNVS